MNVHLAHDPWKIAGVNIARVCQVSMFEGIVNWTPSLYLAIRGMSYKHLSPHGLGRVHLGLQRRKMRVHGLQVHLMHFDSISIDGYVEFYVISPDKRGSKEDLIRRRNRSERRNEGSLRNL